MNLNHLWLFDSVATEGNISRAAETLLVSQPAVSKQLRELERSLGAALFERLPKGVRLTEAGRILHEYSRRIFLLTNEAESAIADLRGLKRGQVVVAASSNVGIHALPKIFVAFRRRFPEVQLRLEIGGSDMVCRKLGDGTAHVGFTEGVIDVEQIEATVQATDTLIAIAAPRHPLAGKRSITAARLCREPFVVRETGSDTKSMVERALAARGLAVQPVMSLGSTEAIKRAVAAGIGVAVVSSLSARLEIEARQLAEVRLSDLKLRRPIYRLVRRGSIAGVAVNAFLKLVDSENLGL